MEGRCVGMMGNTGVLVGMISNLGRAHIPFPVAVNARIARTLSEEKIMSFS